MNLRIPESKSGALPLGDIPILGFFGKPYYYITRNPLCQVLFNGKGSLSARILPYQASFCPFFQERIPPNAKKNGFRGCFAFSPCFALRARQALRAFGLELCKTHTNGVLQEHFVRNAHKSSVHFLAPVARTKKGGAIAPPFLCVI